MVLGKAEAVLLILKEKGDVSSETEKKIRTEQNVEVLEDWLRLAAQAKSAEEVEEKM